MAKYIDARLFFSRLCREAGPETDLYMVHRLIEEAPAVDMERVVRCRDCKWGARRPDGVMHCSQTDMFIFPYSYCWFGVNKEEK